MVGWWPADDHQILHDLPPMVGWWPADDHQILPLDRGRLMAIHPAGNPEPGNGLPQKIWESEGSNRQ
jgi:hypothetical protein